MLKISELQQLNQIWYQDTVPTVAFDLEGYLRDPDSSVVFTSIPLVSVGELYTSMSFPQFNPGKVKDVNTDQVWLEQDLEKRERILRGFETGELARELILASLTGDIKFLLDGQKRARAIFEAFNANLAKKDRSYPVVILSGPNIGNYSPDLSSLIAR